MSKIYKNLIISFIFIIWSFPQNTILKKKSLISRNKRLKVSSEELSIAFKRPIPNLKNLDPETQELIDIYKHWNNEELRKANIDKLFSDFHGNKESLYSSGLEFEYRRNIFEESVLQAGRHNLQYAKGEHSYHLGITKFADITDKEFIKRYTMEPIPVKEDVFSQNKVSSPNLEYPETMDFRTKGIIGPIEDQGKCGSCYSFSSVAATEAAYTLKSGIFRQLSKQELVDCGASTGLALSGCSGGVLESAYRYLVQDGISQASDYPYTARVGKCIAYKASRFLKLSGYSMLDDISKDGFLTMLAKQPLSIAIQMMDYLKLYKGGVVDVKGPCGFFYNHGILAVGYSNSQKNADVPYLILKNTYGQNWGEDGYMLYRMGVGNTGMCAFINNNDSHPIV